MVLESKAFSSVMQILRKYPILNCLPFLTYLKSRPEPLPIYKCQSGLSMGKILILSKPYLENTLQYFSVPHWFANNKNILLKEKNWNSKFELPAAHCMTQGDPISKVPSIVTILIIVNVETLANFVRIFEQVKTFNHASGFHWSALELS